jgi:riboflavin-specific deaminase-like protein
VLTERPVACGPMVTIRQLLPKPAEGVDAYQAYRPADPHARLVRINMVTSADGCVLDADGRSGSIGADGDREIFRCLRALADAIVVGAGTARADGYGPHRLPARLAAARTADGRPAPAPIVVVSASADLDSRSRLFTEASTPTVVVTCAAAPAAHKTAARQAGRLLVAGEASVPPQELVRLLREELGLEHLLVEGGPSLNAGLLDAGLVDELCVTVAPALLGGRDTGLAGALAQRQRLELTSIHESGGEIFARYAIRPFRPLT